MTCFGGLGLAEKTAARLGLWRTLEDLLPVRMGDFSWLTGIKSMVMGLLSGAQGTYATQALRNDEALLRMLSLSGAPEEVTAWRMLKPLGELAPKESLGRVQEIAARRILEKISRPSLLLEGFVPVFPMAHCWRVAAGARRPNTFARKARG